MTMGGVGDETALVRVRDLHKRYGGVVALAGMNLSVQASTIHAVVGENGAGKSTLMKVLAGSVRADGGEISIDGRVTAIGSPNAARAAGIGIVNQELSLFPHRSVLANLFANHEPCRYGLVSKRAMVERSRDLLARLGLDVDVYAPVGALSIGEQQLVELCRVMLEEPRLLILDEPNSALNERESDKLFRVLDAFRMRGVTMLYVSHRLEEVFAICDRITVTRNGRDIDTRNTSAFTIREVIEGMIGGQQRALFPAPLPPKGVTPRSALVVRSMTGSGLRDVSFAVESGEIVGLAGLEGSGVATVLGMLFGLQRPRLGEVIFPDEKGVPRSTTEAARRGICLVPADRRHQGLMLDKSILFNISQIAVGAMNRGSPWFGRRRAEERAGRQIRQLHIKTRSSRTLASQLSGGNQQKVVIGKWLEISPKVILLEDPTRGVDVGAKREIYELIHEMSADRRIVLFSSTELPELVGLCDRIVVIYKGRVAGELRGDAINNGTLLHAINTGELPPGRAEVPPTSSISTTRQYWGMSRD
jgi:ABC-type sugar transport system ATPase subunit